jgi:hypothetical protein
MPATRRRSSLLSLACALHRTLADGWRATCRAARLHRLSRAAASAGARLATDWAPVHRLEIRSSRCVSPAGARLLWYRPRARSWSDPSTRNTRYVLRIAYDVDFVTLRVGRTTSQRGGSAMCRALARHTLRHRRLEPISNSLDSTPAAMAVILPCRPCHPWPPPEPISCGPAR